MAKTKTKGKVNASRASKEAKTVLNQDFMNELLKLCIKAGFAVQAPAVSSDKSNKQSDKVKGTIKCSLKIGDKIKTKLGNVGVVTAILGANRVRAKVKLPNCGSSKEKEYTVSKLTKLTKKSETKAENNTRSELLPKVDYVKAILVATYGKKKGNEMFAKAKEDKYDDVLSETRAYRRKNKLGRFTVEMEKEALAAA